MRSEEQQPRLNRLRAADARAKASDTAIIYTTEEMRRRRADSLKLPLKLRPK